MSVERRAQVILQRAMQREIVIHDDGSQPGMYDLRVGSASAPEVAIECTGAVDPIRTETWNVGPARGPLECALSGDWSVELRPHARVRPILTRIEALLQEFEELKLIGFHPVDHRLRRRNESLFRELDDLEIDSVSCFQVDGSGKVHLDMSGIGGAVDRLGRGVPAWIGEFLRDPQRADVLLKLRRSGAPDCHVFIPVEFGGVPWPVESYLGSELENLPTGAPDLPPPVTVVWITYGVNGLRWDGSGWSTFDSIVPSGSQ
jgi:hypothetical protein